MLQSKTIHENSVVKREEGHLHCLLDRQAVLLNVSDGQYYQMDPMGTDIWTRLESPRTVASLCEELTCEFEVDAQRCKKEVTHFLGHLLIAHLIRIED